MEICLLSKTVKLPLMEKKSFPCNFRSGDSSNTALLTQDLKQQILETSLGRHNLTKIATLVNTKQLRQSPKEVIPCKTKQQLILFKQKTEESVNVERYQIKIRDKFFIKSEEPIIERKKPNGGLALFREQQFRINSANNIIRELDIVNQAEVEVISRFSQQQLINSRCLIVKAFVGGGNNSMLIRRILSNRWWYEIMNQHNINQLFLTNDDEDENDQNEIDCCKQQQQQHIISQDEQVFEQSTEISQLNRNNNSLETNKQLLNSCKDDMRQAKVSMRIIWTQLRSNNIIADMLPCNEWRESLEKQQIINQSVKVTNVSLNRMLIYNHFECNYELANKKNLFINLQEYYCRLQQSQLLFQCIPLTFHVKKASQKDYSFNQFRKEFLKLSEIAVNKNNKNTTKQLKQTKNIWIVKPAENSNRGTGIFVSRDISEIKEYIKVYNAENPGIGSNSKEKQTIKQNQQQPSSPNNKAHHLKHTFIIQKYIENPLLYQKRKIDLRCFLLLTNHNGILKAFWYRDGYIRTSSKEFTTKNLKNNFIHLTNDAIQKQQDDYGKYENGNKLSYAEFQRYLTQETTYNLDFEATILPQMKNQALDCVKSVFTKLDPNRRQFCFELFGLDFMIDEELRVWLIEVNSNPCLEQSSPLLNRIIPVLIHNTFRIAVDPITQGLDPENCWSSEQKTHFQSCYGQNANRFECIFDELIDGESIKNLYQAVG